MSESISVDAWFEKDGTIRPKSFNWKGLHYTVESIGRQWQEEDILHILVMVPGEEVYELSFDPLTLRWHLLRTPRDFGSHLAV